jgi:hypothetical protein
MSSKKGTSFWVLVLFVLLTFIHLFPLSLHPDRSVSETIDSLLNTWILSHVRHQFFSDPGNLFQANIFYPYSNTLTYSEHLLPQALLSLPVDFVSRNPILAYNCVFLLAYFLNGYVMFLFVRYLTKSQLAALACGIMFAFNTYNFNHISHLQLLYAWPIPLAFLFAHKYFEDSRLKDSVLFSLCLVLQALCCVYYGLFFVSILIVVIPVFLILYREKINIYFILKLGVPLVLAGSMLLVFSLPYLSLFNTFGFQRGLTKGANLLNYLAVNPHNVIFARFLNSLGKHEYFLSPGIAALLLTAFFIWRKRHLFRIKTKILRWIALAVVLINAVVVAVVQWRGGFSLNLGLFSLSAHNTAKPAFTIFGVGILILLVSFLKDIFRKKEKTSLENKNLFLYTILFVWALLLSFGSSFSMLGDSFSAFPLPFQWFYNHLPGFKGIRVPSRFAIFVIFATVVLAGYGIKLISTYLKRRQAKVWASIALVLFLNLEYLSLPQRMRFVPVRNDIPPTYRWLKGLPKKDIIIELPFRQPIGSDAVYMYFSIFHRKRMVNGYSGFFPPAILYIRKMFMAFPSWSCLDILKELEVDYVVMHKRMWKEREAKRVLQRIRENFHEDLKLVKEFLYSFKKPNVFSEKLGDDLIFQVVSTKQDKNPEEQSTYREVPPDVWKLSSNRRTDLLPYLKDNDMRTRWTTGRAKTTGDYLLVEFKEPLVVDKVSLFQGRFTLDYALRIRVDVSSDGKEWRSYYRLFSPGEFVNNLVYSPLNLVQNIYLTGEEIKFMRIVQVGRDKNSWWSAVELKIYQKERQF